MKKIVLSLAFVIGFVTIAENARADCSVNTLESALSTATRVFANSAAARRRFARYWRIIYPGSALIRRMWLRAVERRATNPAAR